MTYSYRAIVHLQVISSSSHVPTLPWVPESAGHTLQAKAFLFEDRVSGMVVMT